MFLLSVEWTRGDASPYAFTQSPYDAHNLRQLTILEPEHATRNFNENNIIGQGRFALVYKGLLQDGSIVAINRRLHAPTRYFFHEVNKSAIRFLLQKSLTFLVRQSLRD
jgi:hypothetical protein